MTGRAERMEALLKLDLLKVHFLKREGRLIALNGVDLEIYPCETMALVGESGCGKSVFALSILNLVPSPGRIVAGNIIYKGRDILRLSEKEISKIRGREIGLILQDPGSALNPVLRVGGQISEVIRTHFKLDRSKAKQRALEMMEKVRLPNVVSLYDAYPHQLSGGMKQRILIAKALAGEPALLIADEPTTALDVSIQSQILSLLKDLKTELGLSLLLITHDLSIVAEMADRVAVMYAGRIVEQAITADLFKTPLHPYTGALLDAVPKIDFSESKKPHGLLPLAGSLPDPMSLPAGCSFFPRCNKGDEVCQASFPEKSVFEGGRVVSCYKAKLL